jgi:hypothetical protein
MMRLEKGRPREAARLGERSETGTSRVSDFIKSCPCTGYVGYNTSSMYNRGHLRSKHKLGVGDLRAARLVYSPLNNKFSFFAAFTAPRALQVCHCHCPEAPWSGLLELLLGPDSRTVGWLAPDVIHRHHQVLELTNPGGKYLRPVEHFSPPSPPMPTTTSSTP